VTSARARTSIGADAAALVTECTSASAILFLAFQTRGTRARALHLCRPNNRFATATSV
jgi:hypothetical protein